MAKGFGGLIDTLAYGTLNEFLGMGRSKDGISRPNKYEVTLFPPTGNRGSGGSQNSNIFSNLWQKRIYWHNTSRKTFYCNQVLTLLWKGWIEIII